MPPPTFAAWGSAHWMRVRQKLSSTVRLLQLSGLVGVVAGFGAIVFEVISQAVHAFALEYIVGFDTPHVGGEVNLFPITPQSMSLFLLFLMPGIGGLLTGTLLYLFAPEAAGHGTDAAIASYHHKGGYIRPQVPPIKLIASAITIGTGGSGGREGPTAQIGAGFGSFLATWLGLGAKERRVLLVAGMGAGIGAVFRAPLAGAIFAAEVLYRDPEFESDVIIPAGIASVVSYSIFALQFGFHPLFSRPDCRFENPLELFPYLLLAVTAAAFAAFYVRFFYFIERVFADWKIHYILKPAIGGLVTGAIGVGFYLVFRTHESLAVMAYGYGIIQEFLLAKSDPDLGIYSTVLLLIAVAIGKIVTTSFTISSGGSAGVFGPSLVIGGCIGSAIGLLFHHWAPGIVKDPAAFTFVGMAAFFAAAANTPFSTILMVSEITGNYNLLAPTLFTCIIAYVISDDEPLYRSQLLNRMESKAYRGEFVDSMISGVTVRRFLKPADKVATLKLNQPVVGAIADFENSVVEIFPVVDDNGSYVGLVTVDDLRRTSHGDETPVVITKDRLRVGVEPLRPKYPIDRALELFAKSDLSTLPIVDERDGSDKVIGLARWADMQSEYWKLIRDDDPTKDRRHETE